MQKRIIVAAFLTVVVMLMAIGVVSNISVEAEIQHALRQNLELARVTARYADALLQANLARLYDVSLSGAVDFGDGTWEPEERALQRAYQYSIFSDGLFILDPKGRILRTHPIRQISDRDFSRVPDVARALREERPFITRVYEVEGTRRRALFAFSPLKDRDGSKIGIIGGEISPTHYLLSNAVNALQPDGDIVIELVDNEGTIIASNNPQRVFQCADRNQILSELISGREEQVFRCHRCHIQELSNSQQITSDMLAFASLSEAPWGVTVREPEAQVFAPSSVLQRRFLVLGVIILGCATVLAFGISRSIINPIKQLTQATRRIASGYLDDPVSAPSRDEIGVLSESFELMRQRLSESLTRIRNQNLELEERVEDRTRELEANRERLANLLHQWMNAQEEERKRIARELHDETLQATAALGLSLELSSISLRKGQLQPADLLVLKKRVDDLIDGINGIIRDLRPPMLDDLGLAAAIRWLLERHLSPKGIRYEFSRSDSFKQFMETLRSSHPKVDYELILFRILQEAIINVAKHSEASRTTISAGFREGVLEVIVEDNGRGFDVTDFLARSSQGASQGYGLLGVQERITLLGGELELDSQPGGGTRLCLRIPFRDAY